MKNKIGIFRALDVRFTHAEFAASFRTLDPVFIANMTAELQAYLNKRNVINHTIGLEPVFFVDPVYPLLKKTDFTPWLQFNSRLLQENISDISIFEIYEPYFFYSSQIADVASKKHVPLITEIWTSFSGHPSKYVPPYNFLVKNVIEKTDLFILRSKRAASYLNSVSIPENKKHVLYHGVNLKRFYPAKKHNDKIKILFVGALAAHKGLDDLLAVFPNLADKYHGRIELIICGEGPMQEEVNQLSKSLPIIYKGNVSHLNLPEIYRDADIYCQPSKDYYFLGIKGGEEFAGYTFMEAFASGLPIVTTYCGGIPEIVGTENTLIDQGNKKQLYTELNKFIQSPELRQETGIKNRKRAEQLFDLSKQVELLENLIKTKFG